MKIMDTKIKPGDYDKYVDVTLTVGETKALINLLDEQSIEMIGYHRTKDLLIDILKEQYKK